MDWLRPLLLMFYAPARGMALARDRASLGQSALVALLAQCALWVYGLWPVFAAVFGPPLLALLSVLISAAVMLILGAFFVPAVIFFVNLFEKRGGFGQVLRQEYAATLSCVFYVLAAVNLLGVVSVAVLKATGVSPSLEEDYKESLRVAAEGHWIPPELVNLFADSRLMPLALSSKFMPLLFFVGAWVGVREVFRLGWGRSLLAVFGACVVLLIISPVLPTLGALLGSPFLLLLLFFVLRSYVGEAQRTQRARASFRQNLEAATLNPADASAHYNLGLLHQQRKEYGEARARFLRAAEIDPEETDAHYQLGRIARAEGRLPEAVEHFGQVVARDDTHAQHEIWREVGATYLAAGQFADAGDALERFLDRRRSDPEGLYLMGRAAAGLGDLRAAREWMTACVEAVRTAPAYKYRADKRWLNEAQQFLRTQS
ncbi:MAG TPA: tetratricopeptide repeat protein [Pyrinomonadaceae bacterium]|nr:tetratricopeptide repeat protein [Pyrinomonadaceae bacterium]